MTGVDYRDHRRFEAMQTCERRSLDRGYDFRMEQIVDKSPLWIRTIEVLARPATLFSLALLGGCCFLLCRF